MIAQSLILPASKPEAESTLTALVAPRPSREVILNEDGFKRVLYGAFSSTAPQEFGQSMLYGFERPGDEAIRSVFISRLEAGKKVDALEIGAGTSYPSTRDALWGAPFLARKLGLEAAIRFPGQLHLLVTDLAKESVTVKFIRFSDGALAWWETAAKPHSVAISDDGPLKWAPIGDAPLRPQTALTFYRPLLDQELEAAFGLKVKGGVSFFNLPQALPHQKFDLIFARNLPPYFFDDEHLRDQMFQSIREVLKPEGEALLYFEERAVRLSGEK